MSKINFIDWLSLRRQQISAELQSMPAHSWGGNKFRSLADEEKEVLAAQSLLCAFAQDQLQLEGLHNFAFESSLRDIMECLNQELMNRSKPALQCDTYSTYLVDSARNKVGQLIDAVVTKP